MHQAMVSRHRREEVRLIVVDVVVLALIRQTTTHFCLLCQLTPCKDFSRAVAFNASFCTAVSHCCVYDHSVSTLLFAQICCVRPC